MGGAIEELQPYCHFLTFCTIGSCLKNYLEISLGTDPRMSETAESRMVRQEWLRAVREMRDNFLEIAQEEAVRKWE